MSEAPPSLDLRPDHWDIVRGILRRHVPGRKVLAFGSRATWTAKEYSDLDLAVLGDKPLPLDVASALAESFVESDLPFKVDVVDWASTSESFRKVIERDYVVLVEGHELSLKKNNSREADIWSENLLGELTDNFDSIRVPVKQADRRAGPYPYYGASGIVDNIDDYLFDGEYLLIAEDGENLRTRNTPIAFLADGKFWVNNHAHIVRGNHKANTRYLLYALSALDISGYLTGSTMPKLTQGNMNRIRVSAPPLPEQRAIAHILGTLDNKIELNRRMNETLEAIGRSLFKSWFVDFDPVRAKMEGRDTGLPRHIADLFPDRMVDSELREIPEGWVSDNLGSYVEFQNGYAFKSGDWQNKGVPVVKIGSVKPGRVDLSATSYVSPETVIGLDRFKLNPGDILVGMTGYPGVTGLVPFHEPKPYLNQRVGRIAAPEEHPEYYAWIYAQVRNQSFKRYAESRAHGSAQANVSGRALLEYPVVFPGKALLKCYSECATPLLNKYLANDAESRYLAALRDALLPKLVSGKIRIPRLEKVVGTVA